MEIKKTLKNLRNILLVSTPFLFPFGWDSLDSLFYERQPLNINYEKTGLLKGDKFYVLATLKRDKNIIQLRDNLVTEHYSDIDNDGELDKCEIYALTGIMAGIAGKVKEYSIDKNPEKFRKIQKILSNNQK
ncbi:MAG: hypothetical protein AABY06_02700 [Nanoarchaeota archaeon]